MVGIPSRFLLGQFSSYFQGYLKNTMVLMETHGRIVRSFADLAPEIKLFDSHAQLVMSSGVIAPYFSLMELPGSEAYSRKSYPTVAAIALEYIMSLESATERNRRSSETSNPEPMRQLAQDVLAKIPGYQPMSTTAPGRTFRF